MNIIKYRKIYYSVSGALVALSVAALIVWGLPLGIDFRGGSLIEVEFEGEPPIASDIGLKLQETGIGEIKIQPTGNGAFLIRSRDLSEEEHQRALFALRAIALKEGKEAGFEASVTERRFESIGPTVGAELKRRATIAVVLALLAIVLYIAWAFRKVSRPVSSWKYSLVAITALAHDVLIPTGIFVSLGHFKGIEVDALFISAILTILGFSVHDTIVVFDRVRENLKKFFNLPFDEVVTKSVNETLSRSINTSLTALLVLIAVFVFGGSSVQHLALVLALGIFFGTYSSIFIASPLLVSWELWQRKRSK